MNDVKITKVRPHLTMLESPTQDVISKGARHKYLAHYTSIDVLRQILRYQQFKLNRLDKVNDLEECQGLQPDQDAYNFFVACFTHNPNESLPQWHMYTSGGSGVLIRYTLKKPLGSSAENLIDFRKDASLAYYKPNNIHSEASSIVRDSASAIPALHLWQYLTNAGAKVNVQISVSNIDYNPEHYETLRKSKFVEIKTDSGIQPMIVRNVAGVLKDQSWSHEKEVRICCYFSGSDDRGSDITTYEYVLVPLMFDQVKKIEIVQSPWVSEEQKEEIKTICDDYLKLYSVAYSITTSKYYGKLKRR